MKTYPVTSIEIGSPANFFVKSLGFRTNKHSHTLYEKTFISFKDVLIGDYNDCEVAGITSSALISAVNRLSTSSRDGEAIAIFLGSNFDRYSIKASRMGASVRFKIFNVESNRPVYGNSTVDYAFLSCTCNSYAYMINQVRSFAESLVV